MNSCLYQCDVMHHRLLPQEHKFTYSVFMFYIDLDEVEVLHKELWLFSHNRLNWFNFRDRDHLQFPLGKGRNGKSVKKNVRDYLENQNISVDGNIMLMTNVATLGYAFNPISFYLCFDGQGNPVCSVAEVCNTHGEMKLYLLDGKCFSEGEFRRLVTKNFYVSPFSDLEARFEFIFKIPGETSSLRVDDYQDDKRFLLSALTGQRKKLSDANLLWYGIRFPFITFKIIGLIYWQALVLRWKGLPYKDKNIDLHLQQESYQYKNI